jgi:hypothetical protein
MFREFCSIAHSAEFAYDSQACDSHAPIESRFRVFKNYGFARTRRIGVSPSTCWPTTWRRWRRRCSPTTSLPGILAFSTSCIR